MLKIIADSNDHTIHFKEPLSSEKYQHIRLVSFSLYSIWFKLKRTGEMSVFDSQGTTTVKRIPEGYYSLKSLGQAFEDTLKSATPSMCLEGRSEGVKVKMNTPEEFWKSTSSKEAYPS